MLSKDVSEIRVNELAAPRNENVGTQGFGSGLAAVQTLGGALDAQDKAAAAAANGNLVNEFLSQRIEAGLETEGFRDLDDRAKDQITRGVGEFDRYLTQVVDQKGGNAFTKAEILRTRKAMTAIAANPAQAKAIIGAAGLADKLAGPLADKLKEEEAARREIIETTAQFRRDQALQNGIHVPQADLNDDQRMLEFAATSPDFALLAQTDQLEAQAKLNSAKRDANELERTAGIAASIPRITHALLDQALASPQGGSTAAGTIVSLEAFAASQIAEISTLYPYATSADLEHVRSMITSAKNQAIAYANGDIKRDQMGHIMAALNITGKKIANERAALGRDLEVRFSESQAATDLQLSQIKLADNIFGVTDKFSKLTESSDPFVRNFWEAHPKLEREMSNVLGTIASGSVDDLQRTLFQFGSPDIRSKAATMSMLTIMQTGELGSVTPEEFGAITDFLDRDLPRFAQQDPSGHREMMNGLITHLGSSPELQQFIEQNPERMAPLVEPAAKELSQSLRDSVFQVSANASSLFKGSAAFNPDGTSDILSLFSNVVVAGASFGSGPSQQAAFDNLRAAINKIANDPSPTTIFSNIGPMMKLDEAAASKGRLEFRLSRAAEEFIDNPNFKADLKGILDKVNRSNSNTLSAQFNTLNLLNGVEPSTGFNALVSDIGLSTLAPTPIEETN